MTAVINLQRNMQKIMADIKIYKNSNICISRGLTKSLNILISKSSGEYIARQDSDDISLNQDLKIKIKI